MYEIGYKELLRSNNRFSFEFKNYLRTNVYPDYCCFDTLFSELHVIEIKTNHDSLSRLVNQVTGYYKFSKYVSVFCGDKYLNKVKELVPKETGIYTLLNDKLTIHREAKKYVINLNIDKIVSLLKSNELFDIENKIRTTDNIKIPKIGSYNDKFKCIPISKLYSYYLQHLIYREHLARQNNINKRSFKRGRR